MKNHPQPELIVAAMVRSAMRLCIPIACLVYTCLSMPAWSATPTVELPQDVTDSPLLNSRFVLFGSRILRKKTLNWAVKRGNTDMVAPLIVALRYLGARQRPPIVKALKSLTKQSIGDDWFKWMQWQQAHPEVTPFAGFDIFLSGLFGSLDGGFRDFIYPNVEHSIRLEEIVWGGVLSKTGIPPLDYPKLIPAKQATFLTDDELVFGIEINGDARAYPYRFMDWHEMLNDEIGGKLVSLAYCTLCGSGILYATQVAGHPTFEFGSSGLLYQSNKLMFDRQTHSLWNQFTGKPVVGTLTHTDLQLETLPLVTTTWANWKRTHPHTKVVSLDTGFTRDYTPGAPYAKYFKSNKLMFPTLTTDHSLGQKEQVFGLRISGANKAWPLSLFTGGQVVNDQIGALNVVLIGETTARNVRAYRRGIEMFTKHGETLQEIRSDKGIWQVGEHALTAADGTALTRLPGHLAFWFAWHNYLGGETLATP